MHRFFPVSDLARSRSNHHAACNPVPAQRRWSRRIISVSVLGMGFSGHVSAFDYSSSADVLDEVVVTATKIETLAKDVTGSVTVITEEEIKEKNFTDTTEILRQAAGIQFKQAGGPGQFNYPKLRGFGSGHFLVVVDGVKINEGLSPGVGNFIGQIDPKLIEKIEILRGPQADIYGSDSTAGVIAITTKGALPGVNPELGAEYGSLDWKKGYGSLRGTQGDFGYSLNLAYTDSDGVHDHEYYRNFSPQLKLGYNLGDRLSVEGTLLYMDTKFNYAELRESYAFDSPTTPWWAFQLPDPNQFNENEQFIGALNFSQQLTDNLRHKAVLGYTRKKNSNRDDDDGLLGMVPAPTDNFTLDYTNYYRRGEPVPVYDTGDGLPYFNENENLQLDYNLILDSKLATGQNALLFGYEYYHQKGKKWGKFGDLDAEVDINAFYLNDVLRLLDDTLVVRAGLRFNQHEEYGSNTTGKLGAAYSFKGTDTTLFANYGTSFRAPSFFELFDPVYGNPDVEPEEGRTIEAGLRQAFLGKRLNFELTYWHTKLDDVIAFVGQVNPDGTFGGTYVNRDHAKTQGVELIGNYWINPNWSLNGNYTYTDSRSEKDGEEFRTVQIAYNTANVGLTYQQDRFSLGGNIYYSGPRLRWNGDKETSDYVRVDLFGRANLNKHFTVYGRIENLFDQEATEEIGYEQPGIYAIAGLEWKL
jgi:outer membrane cobalamin receptor